MNVSRETLARLEAYLALLRSWNPRINLVASSTLDDAWSRHVEDSLQLLALCQRPVARWIDLGSGGGLPGLIVAIASPWPETRFTLIESDQRKAAFLRRAVSVLSLTNVTILPQRIEAAPPQQAGVVSARALAPLPKLMAYVARHLKPDGTALLLKGAAWRDEVQEAVKTWSFDLTPHPSSTHPDAAILELNTIHER